MAKSLRNAGLSIESLIEFAHLAQMREKINVAEAQKQILHEQLAELNEKIQEMEQVRALLSYKIETYDEHLAKFQAGKMNENTIEKLWEKKF